MSRNVVEVSAIDFNVYIVTSSYLFSIYFVFKSMIIYTIEKRKYLKSLSDIKQIVINEPIKKEAKKNNKNKQIRLYGTKCICDVKNNFNKNV